MMSQKVICCVIIALGALLFFGNPAICEDISGITVLDLGLGVRAHSMSGAFVGLADDASCVALNPAGLAWISSLALSSSCEAELDAHTHGSVVLATRGLGAAVQYYDFGALLETDAAGNVLGAFNYRNYGILIGGGLRLSDLPFIPSLSYTQNVAVGLLGKAVVVSTLESGSGKGFSVDASMLIRSHAGFNLGPISSVGFGAVIKNIASVPIRYDGGHTEGFFKEIVLGGSLAIDDRWIIAVDASNAGLLAGGLEWVVIPRLSLRTGIRIADLLTWSLGLGVRHANMVVDFAFIPHPYLGNKVEVAFSMYW